MPNEIWQADHTELDVYLLDNRGKERKPWLTIIIDDYSRAICGYLLSFEAPCALHTALALRQAIWRKKDPSWQICGIPQVLYTDHGADFMSLHIEQVCIRLKIQMINSTVGRPQGRGKIERFFETLNENVLVHLPGYSIKGKPASRPSLHISALQQKLESFIIEHYHHRPHGTTGEPPIKRWNEKGFLPNMPVTLEALDLLLLCIDKPRKVQRDGIRFEGFRYIASTLAGFVGEIVTIRYDPRDMAEIRVYYNDEFLCRAICQDIAGVGVSLKEIQCARKAVKRGKYDQIRKAKALLKIINEEKEGNPSPSPSPVLEIPGTTLPKLKLYEND